MSDRRNSRFFVNLLWAAGCWLLTALNAGADENAPSPDSLSTDASVAEPAPVAIDTISFVPPANPYLAGEVANPVDLERHLTQNPTAALFKSMLVPGLGQLGNRRYFKAALFAGLEGWFISKAVYYGRKASDAQEFYDAQTDPSRRFVAYSELDQRRKSRNKFIWFAGITTFVSMFDAYVDAHLSGSPTNKRNDRLGFEVSPDDEGGVRAALSYAF